MTRPTRGWTRVALASLLFSLPCRALEPDYFPLEVGDHWVYRREVFDGSFVGDHRVDTCTVEVTEQTFEVRHGQRYFTSGLLLGAGPCWQGSNPILRKDQRGSIVIQPPDPFEPPDTSAFLEQYPEHAASFRQRLERLPGGDELLYLDFQLAPTRDPFLVAFIEWYHLPIGDRIPGHVPLQAEQGGRTPMPAPFVPGASQLRYGFGGFIESSRIAVFEAGIGLTFESMEGIISLWRSTTALLSARVGGVEYGMRPTAAESSSWGQAKAP